MAAKSMGESMQASGWLEGVTEMSFSLRSMLLTTIILPAMKSSDMHKRAESPGFRPKKSQVMRAEASIRLFSTSIDLGCPVLPLV